MHRRLPTGIPPRKERRCADDALVMMVRLADVARNRAKMFKILVGNMHLSDSQIPLHESDKITFLPLGNSMPQRAIIAFSWGSKKFPFFDIYEH